MKRMDTTNEENIIYELIHNKYDDCISRYILEGIMLYEYNYAPSRMYNIIMNLTLSDRMELILKNDGEYYQLTGGKQWINEV